MADATEINPFMNEDQMTLADVLELIEVDADLPVQRRRNLCSSIRTLGKMMGKSLSYLPAYPGYYRSFFKGLHPEHCDLSRSRIGNIKSDVLFALRQVGCIHQGYTYMAPFTPEWQAFWDRAGCAGNKRRYASRLFHYCSANSINPSAVDDAVSDRFLKALVDESFIDDPVVTHRGIVRIWNRLITDVSGISNIQLTVPSYKETYTTPLEELPQSLQDEVDAYFDRCAGKDILDDLGPLKPMKPKTIKNRRYRLRQIVSGLLHQGWQIEDITSLSQIVEVGATKSMLRYFLDRAGGNTTSQVHSLAILVKTIAKHWVGVDGAHLKALEKLCKRVDPGMTGMTEKNRDRLRQFDDLRNVGLLLNFPKGQVDMIEAQDRGLRNEAVTVQIALAVELLFMAPIRAENLVMINLDKNIQRSRSGNQGVVHLIIPGGEVKNEVDLEFILPEETVVLLDLYLEKYHPRLVTGPCPWLFPGKENKAKTRECFGDQVSKHVFKAIGLRVNLHLFRHIAAKFYLDNHPGGYEVVRRILAHKSMETTTRFYAGMETASASKHFDSEVLKLRDSLRAKSEQEGRHGRSKSFP